MGCDYYIWLETVIEYTDAEGAAKIYTERGEYERRYTYGDINQHLDPDFDVIRKRCPMKGEIAEYGIRDMFRNGQWVCQPAGRERIEALCEENQIPVTAITRVFKRKGGHWR
jgi:hypothetical protein